MGPSLGGDDSSGGSVDCLDAVVNASHRRIPILIRQNKTACCPSIEFPCGGGGGGYESILRRDSQNMSVGVSEFLFSPAPNLLLLLQSSLLWSSAISKEEEEEEERYETKEMGFRLK